MNESRLGAFPIGSVFKRIGLQLVLFLYFYNIPLHYFKLPVSSGKIISVIGFFYILAKFIIANPSDLKIQHVYVKYIAGSLLLIVSTFLVNNIIYSTADFYYLLMPTYYIAEYLVGAYFIVTAFKLLNFRVLLSNMILLGILQSSIMILALFVMPIKDFVFAIMDADPQSHNFGGFGMTDVSFRGFSLASDRTLGMSIFFSSIIVLISILLLNSNREKKLSVLKYALFFIVLSIGGILAARTFFVGLSLSIALMIFIIYRYRDSSYKLKKYSRKLLVVIISSIILIPLILNTFFPKNMEMFEMAYNWAFEMFINASKSGSFKTESSQDLFENHLSVIPTDLQTILIGDPNRKFTNGIHYMGQFTDSGYLRMIYVFGVLGSLPFYIFWIYMIYLTQRYYKDEKGFRYGLIIIGINLFICQVKYDVFPGSSLNFKLIVLFLIFGAERLRNLKQQAPVAQLN